MATAVTIYRLCVDGDMENASSPHLVKATTDRHTVWLDNRDPVRALTNVR